ncbi:MAG: transglutaminase-like domain-containing protein [Candidatus Thermoplasmatota archaeon]
MKKKYRDKGKKTGSSYQVNKKPTSKKSKGGKKRKSSGLRTALVLLLVFILIVAIFFSPLLDGLSFPWEGGRVYPEEAEYVLRRDITLTTRDRINYTIDLPIPESIDNDVQEVHEVDGDPTPEHIEKYGKDWMRWDDELGSTSRGSQISETFSVTYSVSTRTMNWGYSSENSGRVDDIDEDLKEKYNKNQWQLETDRDGDGENDWMIQPGHPVLEEKAEEIVEGENNLYDKARALYDWLNRNVKYRRDVIQGDNRPKHAIWTYEEGAGDCDEQSFLYISMARAVGIPAWIELGILYDRVRDDWGGHGWIRLNFVTNDGDTGWVNIDPVNDQFFGRDALRITAWTDDGGVTDGESHLKNFYMFLTYSEGTLDEWGEEFETLEMDKSGKVILSDSDGFDFISGFQSYHLLGAGMITTLIYWSKKKSKENDQSNQ